MEKIKTEKQILSELTGIPEYRMDDDKGEYITKSGALNAITAYHEQFRAELPSEADFEKIGKDCWNGKYGFDTNGYSNERFDIAFADGFKECLKWMRDNFSAPKENTSKSEQIIKFSEWLKNNHSIEIHDMILQDYIKYGG